MTEENKSQRDFKQMMLQHQKKDAVVPGTLILAGQAESDNEPEDGAFCD